MAGEFGFDLPLETLPDMGSQIPSGGFGGFGGLGGSDFSTQGLFSGGLDTTAPNFDRFFSGGVPGTGAGSAAPSSPGWLASLFGSGGGAPGGATPSPLGVLAQGLGLGATGLGIANSIGAMNRAGSQQRTQQVGQQLATSAATPAVNYGTQLVTDAGAGKLQPAMESAIAQWVQQAKADMRAKLAHLGLGDSTSIQQYENLIDQQALSMRANLLFQEGSQGITALGTGANTGLGLAQSGGQNEALLNNLISEANRTLGLMQGRQ